MKLGVAAAGVARMAEGRRCVCYLCCDLVSVLLLCYLCCDLVSVFFAVFLALFFFVLCAVSRCLRAGCFLLLIYFVS